MSIIYGAPTRAVIVTGLAVALLAAALVAFLTGEDTEEKAAFGGMALLTVGLFSVGIPMAMRESADYATWCSAQGGHVDSSTSMSPVTTVGGNGQVGVGTAVSTTTYCLTSDGRIIDVQ